MTDPIADMLSRIRNAITAGHKTTRIPSSGFKVELARILKEQGYVSDWKITEDSGRKTISVDLAYTSNKESVIKEIKRISKPSRRVYVSKTEIPRVKGGLGICVLSTSKGIMTGSEARSQGIGGELICSIL
ncbi:MAG: 30S ribosomal protein S8 [Candidatus Dadabacteria bacterium]|jgi:small subunit ribosomal protein S8|nr:30S ribosomal protein S8 [Candidatus Dadabacteria bacterium]MCZ6528233.1 30S ribosomal protein S8 [Candidatus Dadabacteria bacterium]MCZ6554575.1 30S ribosomal protein S8 [Candidatus Dadabacteria bacterium]MCZ6639852.1 30S ribosomal protein S8 [Candidatus Dadabacteria bacterium]MCZ6685771.1 30S ribosomal protein S8 [Candidatus Dadabacteria bacterium]